MPVVFDSPGSIEHELFVGRRTELRAFCEWLSAPESRPSILNVCGPGGVGKTALLAAFARTAAAAQRAVLWLDAQAVRGGAAAVPCALGALDTQALAADLTRTRPLLVLDNFESLGSAGREVLEYLLDLLPTGVKPVLASRYRWASAWSEYGGWHGRVRTLPLAGLAPEESRAYVERRGLPVGQCTEQVLRLARGHPLALSLAADLVEQLGPIDLGVAPEWHLAVRSLVERLLRDVRDPRLRELLEAGAVVRQFDEATLAAVAGDAEIGPAFEQLCRLSLVRPAARGLMLHDDARRILLQDLRWRHKARYDALRLRALAYYRERMRTASVEEAHWLLTERLYLWDNTFSQEFVFGDDDPGQFRVDAYRADDRDDVLRLWGAFAARTGGEASSSFVAELPRAFLERLMDYAGSQIFLARDRAGVARGLGIALPVCAESLPLVPAESPLRRLLDAYWTPEELRALPRTAETTPFLYGFRVVVPGDDPRPVAQALVRDSGWGFLSRGVTYLVATADTFFKEFVIHMGFERVPEATHRGPNPTETFEGFVLDLQRLGVETWIEAILEGRSPPRVLRGDQLEQALRDALAHWRDDAWLAAVPLARSAAVAHLAPGLAGAAAVRHAVQRALERAQADASPERALAYRALEAAYLSPRSTSLERASEDLAVSRRTFYRLLDRGVQALARTLDAPLTGPPPHY